METPNKTISFGENPVNIDGARKQAVESGLDTEHCILELSHNSQDYGTVIDITLNGDYVAPHFMNLNSVIVEDNGTGMHHDAVLEKFRGSYEDSESHTSEFQSGRNGVGVKTAFQFWKNILVETTTKDMIPTTWECDPSHYNMIDSTYSQLSKLNKGDPDTELRKYNITMKEAQCNELWTSVPHVLSGTTVTLKNPRSTVRVDVNEIVRRLSHCIAFLSIPDNRITLHFKNEKNNMTAVVIRPFYERNKSSFICHAKGDSTKDIFITVPGKEAIVFPKYPDSDLSKIEFDIKVTLDSKDKDILDTEPSNGNEFILSVSRSNIYDTPRKGGPSNAVTTLLSLDKFENTTGFAYRIHGYIKTDNINLKNALRFNKSAIATQDKNVKKFFDYILSLFKQLNIIYINYLDQFITTQENDLLKEVELEFNKILTGVNVGTTNPGEKQSGSLIPSNPHENTHAEYECNDCHIIWKVPKNKQPSFCAEYNIVDNDGCGSDDIHRRQLKLAGTCFEWTPYLGKFIPARYQEDRKTIYLAQFHPCFITTHTGKNRITTLKQAIIQQALIALTIGQAKTPDFESIYGANLKKHFHNHSNHRHVTECIKVWKTNNITSSEI